MNKYELTVVVSANVEDEVRVNTVEQVKELVARFGGVISNVEDCGKKRLAYEIQHMKDGFYYFIKFDADAAAPAEIESRIRIMDNVIRFLIVKEEA
ncbi:30S ribosomal protein S6 [[Bacteroides] pectinophilus]|jgi:small subunit ribosomal protein S6|uniref:Small ribosomal subunit protein bS6 n=2 Tax=[Bacteroides] pectinophilus TaxID=384638 RepID=B7AWZ9_9FIRM|nr:ribosomal protein S6 [[Bacteroides] pectinophilus ATCC 43243]MCI6021569.1 30S ribosomal protein S6 [[Bacteroides] pectinophilus]MDD5873829.1 30S ribosomal protein S6 [Clostridia bacterium]CDD57008.1 30S ribosomal protein S6 [Bacteroides pectinophilus CAG:437]HBH91930.1 30S ribosomal protein S6 [Bacteroides sp.]